MAKRPLKYLVDISGAICEIEFSWLRSPYHGSVISPVVHQEGTCICYALTVSEATWAVICLKKGTIIPKLSAMELLKNCQGNKCKGNTAPVALEWIVNEGLAEDSAMPLDLPLDPHVTLVKEKASNGNRHYIDEWEPVPNSDAHMKSVVLRQPVVVSLKCPPSLFLDYKGGLIDPYLMGQQPNAYGHSMLLVGFGFYAYQDKSIKYFWELKNSMGEGCGVKGYIHVLRNSSQPLDEWVVFDPVIPICLLEGEIYDKEKSLVVDMSLVELKKIEMNPNLDVIILFWERAKDDERILKNFRRISRFYLPEKDDVKFVRVELTEDDVKSGMTRYSWSGLKDFPVIKVYKHIAEPGKNVRSLRSGVLFNRSQMFAEGEEESFGVMADFFFKKVGGFESFLL